MNPALNITFLGTGTSGGVPSLGCNCPVCRSNDPRDHRLRTAALLQKGQTRILIDAGPDIRQQLMGREFRPFDAILITHCHFDHVGGLDDLRPFCVFGPLPIYCDAISEQALRRTMPYCFPDNHYPGSPMFEIHRVEAGVPFVVGDVEVMPLRVMHGALPIMGYRFGNVAYITDMKTVPAEMMQLLKGVETLIVSALRFEKEHHSHQLVPDAIAFARELGVRETWLVHMTHRIGLHPEAESQLPEGFHFAYDGLTLSIENTHKTSSQS